MRIAQLSFIIIVLFNISGYCQSFENVPDYSEEYIMKFEDAIGYQSENNYVEALPLFLELEKEDPGNANIQFNIGLCYLNSPANKNLAIPYLEKASQNITLDYLGEDWAETSAPAFAFYFLGKAYHINYQFDEAINYFNKFKYYLTIKDKDLIDETNHQIEMCFNAKRLTQNPVNVQTTNLGKNINSEFADYSAVVSSDEKTLIFTSRRKGSTGGEKDYDGQYFEDIYISHYNDKKDSWDKPENMGSNINTRGHEASVSLSHDGRKLFIYKAENGSTGDIYLSTLEGNTWKVPVKYGKVVNSKFRETHACLSPDEKMLFFISDRKKGLGGKDIYVCNLQGDGTWSKPKNLGPQINTQWDEEAPFMLSDGKTLYFSSQGHESMGGYDIFYSQLKEDGNWSTPINIGYPVNTSDDDIFYQPVGDGKTAYYSSIKKGGFGDKDIYKVEISAGENVLASLSGKVIDSISNEPIYTVIEIFDKENNKLFATAPTHPETGEYHLSIPPGKNYILKIDDLNYLTLQKQISIPADGANTIIKGDLKLKRAPVSTSKIILDDKEIVLGERVVLDKIFFESNKAELTKDSHKAITELYFFLFDNPALKIEISGHTDNSGTSEYNMKLSTERAKKIADLLIEGGVDDNRIVYKGYGSQQPIASNETEEGKAKNRRVEFKVIGKYSGVTPFYVISNSSKKIVAPKINIQYSVQISSSQDSTMAQELKEKYNLHQEIYVHKHVNSYKYSAGMFSSYHDANQYCNYLKKEKEIRAFIIAFKDNERISIHEARIVTKEN